MSITVSSSLTSSSKVKPYWNPEHPPPCTNTRSFRSGLPSSSINCLTLSAAASVKTNGIGISVVGVSLTALIDLSNLASSHYCRADLKIVPNAHEIKRLYASSTSRGEPRQKKKPPAPCSAGGFRSSFAEKPGETRSD
ncbi:hypothetical protein BURKHO8Y_140177 [Burkholderia sp. 8Y]|nr:hypothetical protein BURKHO8Y_140177 [Burkholderia sp. 8Y]